MAAAWGADVPFSGPRAEIAWLLGGSEAAALVDAAPPFSTLFPDGGCAVLRSGGDHVFVDCGSVGLGGRGGHGHNDITSVDAVLDGEPLLLDPGTFTYTGSPEWRNRFRSTAAHNAVQVDGEELNRIGEPSHLWSLCDDARPIAPTLGVDRHLHTHRVGHTGYLRLPDPVAVTRTIQLDVAAHALFVLDELEALEEHELSARFTLAPHASVEVVGEAATVVVGRRTFEARWMGWSGAAGTGWVSPSYGVKLQAPTLELQARGRGGRLGIAFAPAGMGDRLESWLRKPGSSA